MHFLRWMVTVWSPIWLLRQGHELPPITGDYMITEDGNYMITEDTGDRMLTDG